MRTVGRKGRMFPRTCSLNTSRSNPEGEEKWWRRTRDQTSSSKAALRPLSVIHLSLQGERQEGESNFPRVHQQSLSQEGVALKKVA